MEEVEAGEGGEAALGQAGGHFPTPHRCALIQEYLVHLLGEEVSIRIGCALTCRAIGLVTNW